jgi:hypothetical protein
MGDDSTESAFCRVANHFDHSSFASGVSDNVGTPMDLRLGRCTEPGGKPLLRDGVSPGELGGEAHRQILDGRLLFATRECPLSTQQCRPSLRSARAMLISR